jgi:hypothetical protein
LRGPGSAEAEAFAQIVQSKGIGQRGSVSPGLCGMVGFDDLVKDPAGDEQAEKAILA